MNTLFPGLALQPGQSLQSDNGLYTLTMQPDGNVVLRDSESKPLWRTGTGGGQFDPRDFIMQTDGNLVLYDTSGQPHWASKTPGNPEAFLSVQDDGNLVVYRAGSTSAAGALWASNTRVPPPLSLQTVVDNGETLNVGNADLYNISGGLVTSVPAANDGVIADFTEEGFWSLQSDGPFWCVGNTVTVNAHIEANWGSGPSWTSAQLQDALARALSAVMQAMSDSQNYQNYSATKVPVVDPFGDGGVVCWDPQPTDTGHYIPKAIQITAHDNTTGDVAAQVKVTYSTGDESSGDPVCGTISALNGFLAFIPGADLASALVGVGTSLLCG